jgi:hypothetical protein
LKSVVHHDHARAVEPRRHRAVHAIARNDGGRDLCEKEGLVAYVRRRVMRGIDAHRAAQSSAIPAAEEKWPLMRGEEKAPDRKRRRCLAGAADGEITEANDRQADAAALCLQSQRRHRSVEPGERTE